ncbi:MAG: 30S ribosomal protein S20 [bacterium]|nr:30S ribosomal protein S20 [bacterium]MCP5041023.1 30S ribosomal protein S20 [bacterium]
MATHKSAIKRHRQSLRRRSRNRHIKVGMGTLVKRFRASVEAKDAAAASENFAAAARAIRKAATKGVIPKPRADRQVSRLAKALGSVTTSSTTS